MLERLCRYNAWANRRVFDLCRRLPASLLDQEARGTSGTLGMTLKHLVAVEDVYLIMLRGDEPGSVGSMEAYLARDLAWFANRSVELGAAYLAWLGRSDQSALQRNLGVSWFDFPVTGADGLLQVLTHSCQHRAQVLSVLGSRGIDVPGLDYVMMLAEVAGARQQ
jgi:uncharacterized damage-inducible protein DinB